MAVQHRNDELVDILSADFVRNKVPLILYGSLSGYAQLELNDVAGTAVTIIQNVDATDVKAILRYDALVSESGGGIAAASGALTLSTSDQLYNDATDILTLAVAANGSVTIQRTAGTATFDVAITLRWI